MVPINKVTILMSTYNGELYLREQLKSIFSQKGVDIELIVRDDGSKDTTLDILKEFQNMINGADCCVQSMNVIIGENVGARESFFELIFSDYESDYTALCDQDDIWDDDKLLVAISKIKEEESLKQKPILYISNLRLVDKNNNFIKNNRNTKPEINKYNSYFELWCTGCTAVYNNQLKKLVRKHRPQNVTMHDTWVGFIAYQLGTVLYDLDPHINYRQHGANVFGANTELNKVKRYIAHMKKALRELNDPDKKRKSNLAREFAEVYSDLLSAEQLDAATEVSTYNINIRHKLKFLFDKRFRIHPASHDLKYRLFILLGKL